MSQNHEYFIAIVECGSISKASEKLFVSQPSLSQYLKRLEKSLGVQLFDRSTSPLRMTYAGERYYQYVKQQVLLEVNMKKEMQDIQSHESGNLRLGVALWRGASLIPLVFPDFHKKYPKITLTLVEGNSDTLEKALLKEEIDIAIFNLPTLKYYEKLTCDILMEEPLLLAAPTNHPAVQECLAKQNNEYSAYPIATFDLVEKIPLIIGKPGQNNYLTIMNALTVHNVNYETLLATSNLTTAINVVKTGIACTFVPGEGAKVCRHPGQVTYFLIDEPELCWPLGVAYRKDSYLTQISQLFIQEVKEKLGAPIR